MHHNWYNVMHIIYGKVHSLLNINSKPVVVLDDRKCVWRHFQSNFHCGGLSGETLSHPSLELAPLPSILTWSSSTICHLVCSVPDVVSLSQVCFAIFLMDNYIEQRICFKFCISNGISYFHRIHLIWLGSTFSLSKTQIITSRHPFSSDKIHKREFAARTEVKSGKCV